MNFTFSIAPGVAFAGPLPLALAPLLAAEGFTPLEPCEGAASDAASRVTPSGLTSRRTLEPEQAAAPGKLAGWVLEYCCLSRPAHVGDQQVHARASQS